jgi:cytochrome bd-type quinol oxidase subunit 1
MLSRPISTNVFFALALAILMAWAGHTSALFLGSSQPAWMANDGTHSHAHGDRAFSCAACTDHYHSSLTADHLHETPHLTTLLSINTQPERAQPIDAPRHSIPPNPIFLIERPPRATFVL